MYCEKCGAIIPEGNRFCEKCGAPVEGIEDPEQEPTREERESDQDREDREIHQDQEDRHGREDREIRQDQEDHHGREDRRGENAAEGIIDGDDDPASYAFGGSDPKKSRRKLLAAVIAAVLIIGGGIGAALFLMGNQKTAEYKEKLDSAQKYLDQGSYEAAMESFDEAISIRPAEPDAYIAKAKAQQDSGDRQQAIETLKQGQNKAKDTKEIEKQLTVVRKEYEGDWKTAYRKVLEENEAGIVEYEYARDFSDMVVEGTALLDLDDDGTPELIFISGSLLDSYTLHVYTYRDRKAVELPYQWTVKDNIIDGTNGFRDVMAGGGQNYIVFREKGQKGFAIYSIIYEETSYYSINRYALADGNLSESGRFERVTSDMTGEIKYYEGGEASSKEVFDGQYEDSCARMEEVILLINDGRGNQNMSEKIWDTAAAGDKYSMSYDEMLDKLYVEEKTEKKSGGSGEKDGKKKTQSLTSDDKKNGEYMERLLDAYSRNDMDEVNECNERMPRTVEEAEVSAKVKEAFDEASYDANWSLITDVDKDGEPELLLGTGDYHADSATEIWRYEEGEAVYIGRAAGDCQISQYPDHNGIILRGQHTGSEYIYLVTIEKGEVKQTEIGYREDYAPGFTGYLEVHCELKIPGYGE